MPTVLIIGYGNPLRGDDGVGYRAAEEIERRIGQETSVVVLAVQQPVPELAEDVSRAHAVIFIDAALGLAPGEVRVAPVEDVAGAPGPTTHHLPPATLLGLAQALFGRRPRAWVVAVGAADFAHRDGLSPAVAAALPEAVAAVLNLVADAGRG